MDTELREFFYTDLLEVHGFFKMCITRLLNTFYNTSEIKPKQSALFWTALFPVILMFAVDIIMSFIFSARSRNIRFFNVLSPKCWRSFNAAAYNHLSADRLKPLTSVNRYSSTFKSFVLPYRVNDSFKLKNGYSATYVGCRYIDGLKYYCYRILGKTYLSPLKPVKLKRFQLNFITNNNTTHNNTSITNYDGSKSGYDVSKSRSAKRKPNIDIICDDE